MFPIDPRRVSANALRAWQEARAVDALIDSVETERIALEQIDIDVQAWTDVQDLTEFVRGERIA
jgi:archaellum component FlaC